MRSSTTRILDLCRELSILNKNDCITKKRDISAISKTYLDFDESFSCLSPSISSNSLRESAMFDWPSVQGSLI